jgi:aminoglycoside phosphotransferase family enzyme/predicted kinase
MQPFSPGWESLSCFRWCFAGGILIAVSRQWRITMTSLDLVADTRPEARSQESLITAMMSPAFYPKRPGQVTHKETHISHLFFAGDLVYKIKKPVRYSFLDYSTLAKRRYYLQEELQLNRRLAPSVYLGVMPLAFDESGWRLGGCAKPGEYTLVMRRLPEKRMLPYLLDTQQVTPEMIRELAQLLAGFHAAAKVVLDIDPGDYLSALELQWRENLADLERYLVPGADQQALQAIKSSGAEFIEAHKDLLARRVTEGWIRDVHGDLHADHICFAPEGIQIFDCIEFSANLRRCDLAAEMAFLSMDMCVRSGESLVEPFIARYGELLTDPDLPRLLPFFECYRALVRTKVHALRTGGWNDDAARYFDFAQRFTWARFKPFLVLICGFSGSGKSTLARALGARLGLAVINSDVVRKMIARKTGRHAVALNQGIYRPAMTDKTYGRMARQAEKQILLGRGAILDAAFGCKRQGAKIVRLAAKHKVPLLVIHCSTSEATTERRLRLRAAQGTDVSDGRWEIYLAQKATQEPTDEFTPESVLELETDAPLKQLVRDCEAFLRSRLA